MKMLNVIIFFIIASVGMCIAKDAKVAFRLSINVNQKVNLSFVTPVTSGNCEGDFCSTKPAIDEVLMFSGLMPSKGKEYKILDSKRKILDTVLFRTASSRIITYNAKKGDALDLLINVMFPLGEYKCSWKGVKCKRIGNTTSSLLSIVGKLEKNNKEYSFISPSGAKTLKIVFKKIPQLLMMEFLAGERISQPYLLRDYKSKEISSPTGINVEKTNDTRVLKFTGPKPQQMTEFFYKSADEKNTIKISFDKK